MRNDLLDLAGRQQGYFTSGQAREVGYSHQAQKYHVDRYNWVREDHGIFRLRGWPHSTDDEYVRWHLWSAGKAIVSHNSAMTLHDVGDVNPARIHLAVPRGFRKRSDLLVLHRADVPESDIQQGDGFRMTRADRAIAESAACSLSLEHVIDAVQDALVRGLTTPRRLREVAGRLDATEAIETALDEVRR